MSHCAPCSPTRSSTNHIYFASTRSLCPTCKRAIDAKVVFRDGSVFLAKHCLDHGPSEVLLASSVDWYLDALSFVAPSTAPDGPLKPTRDGCPFDCGPCRLHQQQMAMPVVPITSACNLNCPVCYTVNRNIDPFFISKESFAQLLDRLGTTRRDLDIINFTGGEPTLHPELPELLRMARQAGFRRITLSTNGLKLRDEAYVRELAALDTRVVLSLDSFDDATDTALLGATTLKTKLQVLDLLEKHNVTTTILPAIAKGLNDRELPALLELVLQRKNICSLEAHPIAFTGQGGTGFDRSTRITIPDLHRTFHEATHGRITEKDFVPSPLAHPLCYSIAYLLVLDGAPPTLDQGYVPFTRFLPRERVFELLSDSLYLQPRDKVEQALGDAIDEIWANPDLVPEAQRVLSTLKRLIQTLFPSSGPIALEQRQAIAERSTKAIYIHSHMDEETFDMSRILKCSIAVPEADGSSIPTCSYNILYRGRDPRFRRTG
ncbi:MAG: radical SAM protein [Myxococcales bacterium]